MLRVPNREPREGCIFAIDPGTLTMGLAIIWFDLETLEITRSNAITLRGDRLAGAGSDMFNLHGDRLGRIFALEDTLTAELLKHDPVSVVSESAFYSRKQPTAFGPLMEAICGIRTAIRRWNPAKSLRLVEPSVAKRAVSGNGGADKYEVRNAVMKLTELRYEGDIPIECLDEHSTDSLAIGYSEILEMRGK